MKIDARADPATAALFRLVRLDTLDSIGGELVWADETTGGYGVKDRTGEMREFTIPGGIRLVPK